MSSLNDPEVKELLEQPNCAVISTHNEDNSILSTVVWVDTEDGSLAVNRAIGRKWPAKQRDPRATPLVAEDGNLYNYVEVRGTATATEKGADDHINALTKKYINRDEYPFRQPGESGSSS